MIDTTMICSECQQPKDSSAFNAECFTPTVCFKCRVSSIKIGFGGHRETFHSTTIKESQDEIVRMGRANGLDPELKTNHGAGLTAGQMAKVSSAVKAKPTKAAL